MAVVNLTQRSGSGVSGEERPVLPTDIYRMRCVEADIKDDTFAKPNKDGTMPQKFSTVWEVVSLTEEQQEAADEAGEKWTGVRVWKDFALFYGTVKEGGPSKLKAFIDSLVEQGALASFDLATFDTDSLVDIEQRCTVEQYIKSQGVNVGKPGNKITAFTALKRSRKPDAKPVAKNTPQPVESDEDLPF